MSFEVMQVKYDNPSACPYCKTRIGINTSYEFCHYCGGRLLWDDYIEYRDISAMTCIYDNTTGFCKYYGKTCVGSKNCEFANSKEFYKKYIGKLTYNEQKNAKYEFEKTHK